MGTKERREREREALRGQILEATRVIAAREGWQSVTIRKVADAIEYSPAALYEYFESKEALLLALVHEADALMLAELRAAHDRYPGDPHGALLAMTSAYWDLAMSHPELYMVVHGLDGVPFCTDSARPEAAAIMALLYETISALGGTPSTAQLDDASDIAWATIHGLVTLTLAQQIEGGPERGRRLAGQAIRSLILVWRQQQAGP